jgi:serine/threonine protein kinase
VLSFLGEGGFGSVYKVRHKLDGNLYAIKKVDLKMGKDQDIRDHKMFREIRTMNQVHHRNTI